MKTAFILLIALYSLNAKAVTYYVATNGSDANVGTSTSAPFRTIVYGVNRLRSGDTLYVRGGSYNEFIDTNRTSFANGTSWSSPTTLAAYVDANGNREVVTLSGGFNIAGVNGREPSAYLVIDGLRIDAGGQKYDPVSIYGSHHIRIQNCEIRNSSMNLIQIMYRADTTLATAYLNGSHEILNNYLHDNVGSYGAHAVYVTTSNNIIRGNTFNNIGQYAIHQWQPLSYESTGQIPNNNIYEGNKISRTGLNTVRYGAVCCGAIVVTTGTGAIVRNNVVFDTMVSGIDVGTSTNAKVYNNTVYGIPGSAINISKNAVGVEVRNNIAISKSGAHLVINNPNAIVSNNITSNPGFLNPSGGDFRLSSSASSAIDKGMPLSLVTNDFALRPRVGAPDLGAYELGSPISAGSAPVPSPSSTPAPPSNLRAW
jgi:hypothetical protein